MVNRRDGPHIASCSDDNLVAAAPRWTPQCRQDTQRDGAGWSRARAEAADRLEAATCFKCGRLGHFAFDCRRQSRPPQLPSALPPSSPPDVDRHLSWASQHALGHPAGPNTS
ncbi:unnamed protein product [Lampetra planeri]